VVPRSFPIIGSLGCFHSFSTDRWTVCLSADLLPLVLLTGKGMTDYRLALLETARSLFLGGCHSLWRREGPIGPELFMSSLSSLFPAEVSFLWSAGKSHGSSAAARLQPRKHDPWEGEWAACNGPPPQRILLRREPDMRPLRPWALFPFTTLFFSSDEKKGVKGHILGTSPTNRCAQARTPLKSSSRMCDSFHCPANTINTMPGRKEKNHEEPS